MNQFEARQRAKIVLFVKCSMFLSDTHRVNDIIREHYDFGRIRVIKQMVHIYYEKHGAKGKAPKHTILKKIKIWSLLR